MIFLTVAASAFSYTALAQDSTHGWVKNGNNPVFGGPETGTMFDANVITEGKARFNMYVSWRPEMAIALTYSDDGINWSDLIVVLRNDPTSGWERYEHNPIIVPEQGSWDGDACYKPTVYRDAENNMWHLWYNGRSSGAEYIGYVTHEGLDITS